MSIPRQAPDIPQFSSIEELQGWIATADGSVVTQLFESLRPTDPDRLEEMARIVDEALELAREQTPLHSPEVVAAAHSLGATAR